MHNLYQSPYYVLNFILYINQFSHLVILTYSILNSLVNSVFYTILFYYVTSPETGQCMRNLQYLVNTARSVHFSKFNYNQVEN